MHDGASPWSAQSATWDAARADTVAAALQILAAPVRLLILGGLRDGPLSVVELAESIGLRQSAVSHQLRLLRDLGLVASAREGHRIVYRLHDVHVAGLLDETTFHVGRLKLSALIAEPPSPARAG